ncbi:hypothetical protein QBC47DRAFT_35665 [Echria macrotheca]|uniref:Uncharacterized protein n=1 Tax=Echria macrotheca TaxID=438768 RepID=A0AAJ0B9D3_9PEZI|nr:hypothetical protein QBC47DRAFT_35665 [Echria macrotheca]
MASACPEPYVLSPDDMTLDAFDPMLSMQLDLLGGEIFPSKTPSDPSGGLRNSETEAMISLSQLSVELSRQLAVVHTYYWPELLMQGKLMNALVDESPVSIIIVKTEHFISVLRRLLPPVDVQSPSDELDDFGLITMDTSFRLMATTYLLILVDYLQIIRVYNTMFEQIVAYFSGQVKDDITSDSEMAIVKVQPISSSDFIKGFT